MKTPIFILSIIALTIFCDKPTDSPEQISSEQQQRIYYKGVVNQLEFLMGNADNSAGRADEMYNTHNYANIDSGFDVIRKGYPDYSTYTFDLDTFSMNEIFSISGTAQSKLTYSGVTEVTYFGFVTVSNLQNNNEYIISFDYTITHYRSLTHNTVGTITFQGIKYNAAEFQVASWAVDWK